MADKNVVFDASFSVESAKAIRALEVVAETLDELEEDYSYREDVKRAARAFRYFVKRLDIYLYPVEDSSMDHDFTTHFHDTLSHGVSRTSFGRVDQILVIALRLISEFGCPYREQITKAALDAYDTTLAPIDLPGIPNSYEPAFDNMVRDSLVRGLDYLGDLACGGDA